MPPRYVLAVREVTEAIDELLTVLSDHGAAVFVAPPGTGKTTGVPPTLLDQPWMGQGRVVMVEPRRIAARLAAARLAENAGERLGGTYGYAVRGERVVGPETRVEVVTTGLMLRRVQHDPGLDGVSAVILDEFHERSIEVDLLLALLCDVRGSLRDDLRLVVMSATLDAPRVASVLDAAVITATARAHPVATHHRPGSIHDPLHVRVARVVREALGSQTGDVLVFLPGRGEIRRTARELTAGRGGLGEVEVVELHGSLSPAEQDAAVHPSPTGRRRVILATSIAESSITVPGVRIVVDAGRRRTERVDPVTGLPALVTTAASRASADQRRGRAGRLGPGVAYRLWAENEDRFRPAHDLPEVLDGDLGAAVLQMHAWGVRDAGQLRWVDDPDPTALERAETLLIDLGALDDSATLTQKGRRMAEIGFHPRMAAVALAARTDEERALAAEVLAVLETARAGEIDLVERVRELRRRPGAESGDTARALRDWRRTLRAGRGSQRSQPGSTPPLSDNPPNRPKKLDGLAGSKTEQRRAAPDRELPNGELANRELADRELANRELADRELGRTVARLVLAGFPDRLARRRPGTRDTSGQRSTAREVVVFHQRSGGEVALAPDDPLASQEWLVVVDLDAGLPGEPGRVHLAVSTDSEQVLDEVGDNIELEHDVEWDTAAGALVGRTRRRLGAITVSESRTRRVDDDRAADVLAEVVASNPDLLGGWDRADGLRARVAFCREVSAGSQVWPDWSTDALLADIHSWLGPALRSVRDAKGLARLDAAQILRSGLDWSQRRDLDELAPPTWRTAQGREVRLTYGGVDGDAASVTASVRLRDVLGTDRHPTVGGGVPISIELLSPAGRPIQRTSDLPGFWRGSYAQVRSEMRGRYPKHPWPEEPWNPLPQRPRRP